MVTVEMIMAENENSSKKLSFLHTDPLGSDSCGFNYTTVPVTRYQLQKNLILTTPMLMVLKLPAVTVF